jgi:hypothetical protein
VALTTHLVGFQGGVSRCLIFTLFWQFFSDQRGEGSADPLPLDPPMNLCLTVNTPLMCNTVSYSLDLKNHAKYFRILK